MTKKKAKKNTTEAVEGDVFTPDPTVVVEPVIVPRETIERESANALANRIWSGQSVSLPLVIRVQRIRKGLEHHKYPEDEIIAIKLPDKNAYRHI